MTEDWHALVSQPQYQVKTEKDVYITMPDGIRLAADVYRPNAQETVQTVYHDQTHQSYALLPVIP